MGITLCLLSKYVATLGLNPYSISHLGAHSKSPDVEKFDEAINWLGQQFGF